MVDIAVNPRKLALINVDLQNVFVEGTPVSPPDGPAVVARVNKLAAACRKAGVLVIHTAHVTRTLRDRVESVTGSADLDGLDGRYPVVAVNVPAFRERQPGNPRQRRWRAGGPDPPPRTRDDLHIHRSGPCGVGHHSLQQRGHPDHGAEQRHRASDSANEFASCL